jgi:hypothetical protein
VYGPAWTGGPAYQQVVKYVQLAILLPLAGGVRAYLDRWPGLPAGSQVCPAGHPPPSSRRCTGLPGPAGLSAGSQDCPDGHTPPSSRGCTVVLAIAVKISRFSHVINISVISFEQSIYEYIFIFSTLIGRFLKANKSRQVLH